MTNYILIDRRRSRDWRAIFPGQCQRAIVVRRLFHTSRNSSKFRIVDAFRTKFHGPNRPDDVHWTRRVY